MSDEVVGIRKHERNVTAKSEVLFVSGPWIECGTLDDDLLPLPLSLFRLLHTLSLMKGVRSVRQKLEDRDRSLIVS
jgi:hypothetical protein